ncbi:MAG TPA: alpha/beta fold hydrolase [Limnobacter sp.]|uniref:RBBP9/YdeN family alpha/beta hydrolase n=1 Tax=Limnobacter sp. TaxID=2003368 RepID=UPI002ED8A5AD
MQPPLCLTIPGLHGSDANHWQSWVERELPNTRRVQGINFDRPVIAAWADAIRDNVRQAPGHVILLAHSFGCLASVMAISDHESKVCAVVLVAPATPSRFSASGLISEQAGQGTSIVDCMPDVPLNVPGLVVASTNDPWMTSEEAFRWAATWGLHAVSLSNAGHINTASGYGRWPSVVRLVQGLRDNWSPIPLGELEQQAHPVKQRFTALAKARRITRVGLQ